MYTGTCALLDANNSQGDGNGGWACYNKAEKYDFSYLKQSAIDSMAADTEEDEDDYVIEGEPADDDEKNEEDLFVF